jgi:hypothetical protein
MSQHTELLERFRRGPELVAAMLTGVAGSEQDFQPEPGKWSIRQIVAHLSDSEMSAALRFRKLIAEDSPALDVFDQDAWATKLDYATRKPSHSLDMFRRVRAENYELLKSIPDAAFERTGTHPKRGVTTLLFWVEIYARHAEKHAEQMRAIREKFKQQKAAQTSPAAT